MAPTYEELARDLLAKARALGPSGAQHWVGLVGGPGAGKSTLAAQVVARLNEAAGEELAVVVPMDGFHYARSALQSLASAPGGCPYGSYEDLLKRRGAPWTFDAEALCEAVLTARNEGAWTFPTYSRAISDPVPDGVRLQRSHRVVVVEGNYLFLWDDPRWTPLQRAFDERWFLRCASVEEQRERLISRHLETWTEEKVGMWGDGREGAGRKVDANDVLNLITVEATNVHADRVILSLHCNAP